jgi:hypothetical protein
MDLEVEMFNMFLHESDGWEKYLFRVYPELKQLKKYSKEASAPLIKSFIQKNRQRKKKEMQNAKSRFQRIWKKVGPIYLQRLSTCMQESFPANRKTIYAYIGLNPICPRFLDTWSFSIFYGQKDRSKSLEVIMHEICHFIWFQKWKKVFPKAKRPTFEAPYAPWLLSELAAPVILNSKEINPLLKQKAQFYLEHQRLKIGRESAPVAIGKLYQKRKSMEDFMRKGLKMVDTIRK